jgi:hypothetical protein
MFVYSHCSWMLSKSETGLRTIPLHYMYIGTYVCTYLHMCCTKCSTTFPVSFSLFNMNQTCKVQNNKYVNRSYGYIFLSGNHTRVYIPTYVQQSLHAHWLEFELWIRDFSRFCKPSGLPSVNTLYVCVLLLRLGPTYLMCDLIIWIISADLFLKNSYACLFGFWFFR